MTTNRFQRTPFIPSEAEEPESLGPENLDDGVHLEASAMEIPLSAAVEMVNCRFEEKGIRKDFGHQAIGGVAPSRIIGLAEHKFIDSDELFHRLVRIYRNATQNPVLQVWDGSSWVTVDTATQTVRDQIMVMFSTQGLLVMTEGTQILKWSETVTTALEENDFPPGNSITSIAQDTRVMIPTAGAVNGVYTVNYSVDITGAAAEDKILTIGFYWRQATTPVLRSKIAERTYTSPAASASDSWPNESIELFIPSLGDGDELEIEVDNFQFDGGSVATVEDPFQLGATQDLEAEKSVAGESEGDKYWFREVVIRVGAGQTHTVDLLVRKGGVWTVEKSLQFTNDSSEETFLPLSLDDLNDDATDPDSGNNFVIVDGMTASDAFGLDIDGGAFLFKNFGFVEYTTEGVSFDVHGFNKVTDIDPLSGEVHTVEDTTVSTFDLLSPDAPNATFIFPFGDRLLALQDTGNPQLLSWSVDGDITDWTGEGSGSTSLLDARSDPIDDLMAMGAVASNVAALFRKRSIMKVSETGNPLLAIAATHWIEGIGTESPLSVEQVQDGLMFLGHDLMVYYFSGTGRPLPVGKPIQRELLEVLDQSVLDDVDATYDPVFQEYWMSVPNMVWIFDVGAFIEEQKLKWRSRDIRPSKLATVSRIQ